MAKVIVGMSGGVDSAVAAYLLKKEGYEVIGVTLRTWTSDTGEEGRCCELDEAALIARKIGIPHHIYNVESRFRECVIEPFIDDYINGRTPNPCVECNRYIKWEQMIYIANVLKAEYIATGHYANIVKLSNGRYTVNQADQISKDQTYMVYKLTQEQLSRTLMPLGKYTKEQVREIAQEIGLSVAQKPDSQEICFVIDGKYSDFIEKNRDVSGLEGGSFVDENGRILGEHKGIIHYTVGQRKGLGLAMGEPVYVKSIDPVTKNVVIADDKALYSDIIYCNELNFLGVEDIGFNEKLKAKVRIRYHHKGEEAVIERSENDEVKITFQKPVRAATPGQSAVFYDADGCVIGGGKICKT